MKIQTLSKKEKLPFIIMEEGDLFNSYNKCNFTLTRPSTNLNKIKIKSTLRKKLDKYPKKYGVSVYYNDNLMKKIKTLGKGSYGKIVLYEYIGNNSKVNSVVVKLPFNDSDPYEEPNILKSYMYKAFLCHHYVIPIRSIEDQHGNPFIIMQQANGSLADLDMDNRLKLKIIIQLTKIIKCFYNHGFIYMDLKKENLLYRCRDDKIEFFLGDIGSFSELGKTEKLHDLSSSTYVPPEYAYGDEKIRKADRQTMLYTLGATIADLYNLSTCIYFKDFDNDHVYTSKEIKKIQLPKFYEQIRNSNIPENIKEIILALTSISPKKRLTYNLDIIFEKLCPKKK
jgi:serine/threonine protein kinase